MPDTTDPVLACFTCDQAHALMFAVDNLTDAEFWDYVLNGRKPADGDDDYFTDDDPPILPGYATPCPECGSVSACAFDSEGRPLIHATEKES